MRAFPAPAAAPSRSCERLRRWRGDGARTTSERERAQAHECHEWNSFSIRHAGRRVRSVSRPADQLHDVAEQEDRSGDDDPRRCAATRRRAPRRAPARSRSGSPARSTRALLRQHVRVGRARRSTRASRSERPTAGSSAREHARDVLCRASRRTRAAAARRPSACQIGRERGGAGRVVRGVEQQLAAVGAAAARSSRPGHSGCASPAAIALSRHRNAARVEALRAARRRRRRSRADARLRRPIATARRRRPDRRHGSTSAPRCARDLARSTAAASARSGPITTGTPGLMMPAFSSAISRSVDPRYR